MLLHSNSLSNKMDNSLLAVRDINHKYIVVEERECEFPESVPGTRAGLPLMDQERLPVIYGIIVCVRFRLEKDTTVILSASYNIGARYFIVKI